MELRDIRYFLALGAHGHVRRAAESVGLTQPALTKSIRRLEADLGAKLVERNARGIALTALGTALLDGMQRMSLSVSDVRREIGDLVDGRAGHLRVGASPMSAYYVTEAFGLLLEEADKVTMDLLDSDNDVMLPALRRGELDFVFNVTGGVLTGGMAQEHVLDETWVVFAAATHRLARRRRVALADLERERWALSPVNVMPANVLPRTLREHDRPPPQVAFQARPILTRLQLVAGSDLLGFAPKRIVDEAAAQYRLKRIPVPELTLDRPIGVIRRQGAYLSPAATRLIAILKSRWSDRSESRMS